MRTSQSGSTSATTSCSRAPGQVRSNSPHTNSSGRRSSFSLASGPTVGDGRGGRVGRQAIGQGRLAVHRCRQGATAATAVRRGRGAAARRSRGPTHLSRWAGWSQPSAWAAAAQAARRGGGGAQLVCKAACGRSGGRRRHWGRQRQARPQAAQAAVPRTSRQRGAQRSARLQQRVGQQREARQRRPQHSRLAGHCRQGGEGRGRSADG